MQILTYKNQIMYIGTVEKGVYPEADKTRELFKITNEHGKFYAVPDFLTLDEVDNLPEDFVESKYMYDTEKGFYENPDWVDPNTPTEIELLQLKVDDLSVSNAELIMSNAELSATLDDLLTNVIPTLMTDTTEESEVK